MKMDLSEQDLSFGDFSDLGDADLQRVHQILHGRKDESSKRVEFPWDDQDWQLEDGELPPRQNYHPMDHAPPIGNVPSFVVQYPVTVPAPVGIVPGIGAIPAMVGPYSVPPPHLVNGIAIQQTYPQPVNVDSYHAHTDHYQEASPHYNNTHTPNVAMCNGPAEMGKPGVHNNQVNVATRSDDFQQAPEPDNELDFVYRETTTEKSDSSLSSVTSPGTAVSANNQRVTLHDGQVSASSVSNKACIPKRTTEVLSSAHQETEKVPSQSEQVVSSVESPQPVSPDSSQASVAFEPQGPPLPSPAKFPVAEAAKSPKPKVTSWAGLFKDSASSSSGIVTYVGDSNSRSSPVPALTNSTKKVEVKLPVPVTEDSAASKLGNLLVSQKMNHSAIALQPRGLVNQGNWCYINATLQALAACPPFYHLMKKLSEFPLLTRGKSSTPILDNLVSFISEFVPMVRPQGGLRGKKSVELIPGTPFEPTNVYKMLQVIEANPTFKLGKQEDAEEFLSCILDGMHEEMAAAIRAVTGEKKGGDNSHANGFVEDEDHSSEDENSWQQVGPKKKSVQTRRASFAKTPIADIFVGHIRSAVYKASSKESATLQPFFTLQLDIQGENLWTVKDALDGLVSKESVQGYTCSKTNQEVEIVRKITLEELPPVLILHLKCFVYDKAGGCQKLQKKIDFEVELNITKELLSATARSKIQQVHRSFKLFADMPRFNQKGRSSSDRTIRFKCSLQNTILDVLRARPGWQEVTGDADWDFYWCDVWWMKETFDHAYLDEHMRINHFRNHYELTRKNLMVKNLKRLRRQLERESGKLEAQKCDFFPTTYELPSEYHIFVDEFRRNPGSIWIMKPIAKSQGKGIFLFKRLKDITDWKKGTEYQPVTEPNRDGPETYVVQRYIENPYLIGGRKFDIRIYILVTSYSPLKVWLYRNGFARFSNTRFSLESIDDNYIHLTNVAIQKTAPDYDPEKGCKWSTQQLRRYLIAKHGQETVDKMFQQINEVFVLSLQSTQKIMINDKHCFELYGYDILIDSKLKPWLLEINASPSLTASSKEDYDLKFGLLNDVINVLDMENRLTGKEKRIGGFDLLWDDGPVFLDDSITSDCINNFGTAMNSFLGCQNDRRQNLKQVYQIALASKKMP